MYEFKLSNRSLQRLEGVDPRLVKIVRSAINITKVDFGVSEGLRTPERQRELVDIGASQTLNSKHLTGLAVDLFAYVDGGARWELPYYFEIARAMQIAALGQRVPIRWGGAWTSADLRRLEVQKAHQNYLNICARENRQPFIDAGHFELN